MRTIYQLRTSISPWRQLPTSRVVLLLFVVLVGTLRTTAAPVHFWISDSNNTTTGPPTASPVIDLVADQTRYLHVWAQPSASNKWLQNFSLNVVGTNSAAVSFVNNSVTVYNPTVDGKARYEYIRDSANYDSSGPVPIAQEFGVNPYRFNGIHGYTLFDTNHGFGGTTCGNDPFCRMTPTGPAWLVTSFAVKSLAEANSAEFYLQIGSHGINQSTFNSGANTFTFEPTTSTKVVFGASGDHEYSPYDDIERWPHDVADTADFVINTASLDQVDTVLANGGSFDHLDNGQAPTGLSNVQIAGGVVTVTGAQQAYAATVNGGRLHLDSLASLAANVTVNPGGSISGDGWLSGNLTLAGNLSQKCNFAMSSTNPLKVFGAANLTGGMLTVAPGFSPPVNQMFTALTASGGIQGTLTIGQLPTGLSLKTIQYTPNSVMLELQSAFIPGDFNHDNKVDAADYIVWRKSNGSQADYDLWRQHFGQTAGTGASNPDSGGSIVVPEPTTLVLAIAATFLAVAASNRNRRHC